MSSIFIITRYSILSRSLGVRLRHSSEDFAHYKRRLFSDNRLNARHIGFTLITVPSIFSQLQCPSKVVFLVITSTDLPCHHLDKLKKTLSNLDNKQNIKTILSFVNPLPTSGKEAENVFPSFNEAVTKTIRCQLAGSDCKVFASVRLDDDDALSSSYCINLSEYVKKELIGFPVLFPYGLQGFFSESTGTIKDIRRFYRLNVSPGSAFINGYSDEHDFSDKRVSVYGLGNHSKIESKNAIIYDSRRIAFFRTFSSFNDSGEGGGRGGDYTKYLPHISASDMHDFNFLSQIYPRYNQLSKLRPKDDEEFDKFSASKQVSVLRAKKKNRTRRLREYINGFFPKFLLKNKF